MVNDISGFGLGVTIVASNTFPSGAPITQFADDADPLDIPSINIADTAMGLNGDLLSWSKANPLPLEINVIPGSDDDILLGTIAEANRVGQGKTSAKDIITIAAVYPDGTFATFIKGKMTEAPFGKSVASSGRMKSKKYVFKFENKIGG